MNIFERASKQKLRFGTGRGLLSVEEVWELSLTALDALARRVNKELKETDDESFIDAKTTVNTELNLRRAYNTSNMSKANQVNKFLWLVTTKVYNFTIAANSKKECKELINELAERIIVEEVTYNKIGNVAPTYSIYDNWEGESFILTTNFYNI